MEAGRRRIVFVRTVLALLVTLVSATALGRQSAFAAGSSISILGAQATDEFPTKLTFEVVAQSLGQINSVRLAYRISTDPVIIVDSATIAPGNRVDATRVIDLTQEYVPPGVVLHFQWQIQDSTGAELDTQWVDFSVPDRRFLWHQTSKGNVILHWYSGDSQFADAVVSAGAAALASAQSAAGTTSTATEDVFLYANEPDFRSSLATGSTQWVGGETYPTYHEVVVLAPPTDTAGAQRVVAHEMTHAAIDSGVDSPFGPLPTWLDEGLAMSAEGVTDPTFTQALQAAEKAHQLVSIQAVSGTFPDATDAATLAYAESDSLVRYFVKTYGQEKIALLVEGFRNGETSDDAFQHAIGRSSLQFQQDWLASLGQTDLAVATTGAGGGGFFHSLTAPIDAVIQGIGSILDKLLHGKSTS